MSHLRTLILVVLAGACGKVEKAQPDAAPSPDAPSAMLTVNVTGSGHVTSTPTGIDCSSSCSGTFEQGTTITLAPASDSAGMFMGWGGACSGAGGCEVVLTGDTTVTATFGCGSGSMTFAFTGAPQSWSPPCASTFNFDVQGAGGGLAYGGAALGTATLGGRLQASLVLHPTDVLNIYVGGAGTDATAAAAGNGGFNGGAGGGTFPTTQFGGGGGGATDVRLNGAALTDRVLVAGGAGGVASCSDAAKQGGAGGGLTGGDGTSCGNASEVTAKGGTQSAGGAGGSYPNYCTATAGSSGLGGAGCSGTMGSGGGGGGGGYFGGGGGSWNGGAGGSSYAISTATNVVHTQGFTSGNGQVIISW